MTASGKISRGRPLRRVFILGICGLIGFIFMNAGSIHPGSILSRPDIRHSLTLKFQNRMGVRPLRLLEETYTNGFGETMIFTRCKYYISHISAIGADQLEKPLSAGSFLIDESDSLSTSIVLPALAAGTTSLSFVMGVDSLLNVNGVQTGELDPLKGMFWTWNSGYIFFKLEGKSDASPAPSHTFSWDIGGFKQPANASRKITLPLPVRPDGPAPLIIEVKADLGKIFEGSFPLKIAEHPVCHQPGSLAMQIADNYSHMFSIPR